MAINRQEISGTIAIDDRQVYFDDLLADEAVFDLGAQGVLVLVGDDALDGVTIDGAGEARALGPLAVDDGLTLEDGATFVNAAAATENGGELTLDDSATLRNLSGATWTLAQGAGIAGTAGSRFVNFGLLQQTGADDASTISAAVYDHGTIDVEGQLDFSDDVTRLFGAVEGTGSVSADLVTLVGASISCASFSATRARLLGDVQFATASASFGALALADDTVAFHGDESTLGVGVIIGAGEIDFSGKTKLVANSPRTVVDVAVVNSGVLTVTSADDAYGVFFGGAETNLAGATWIDATPYSVSEGSSTFENQGTFIEDGEGNLLNVDNDGLITLGTTTYLPDANSSPQYPSLGFGGLVSGTGTIDIGLGNVGVGYGSVEAGQTFAFTGTGFPYAPPTLTLDNAPS